MGSNSSKPAVPKRKKVKPKYSRVLVKTISNSNIQEVALAVINTQSTIERNRRLSNVPGTSAISPPPRPIAPKPQQIHHLPTPKTTSKPHRIHRKRSSSLSEKSPENTQKEPNLHNLKKSKSLCDNHKLNVLQIKKPLNLLNIPARKNIGTDIKIQGCSELKLETSEPAGDVIAASEPASDVITAASSGQLVSAHPANNPDSIDHVPRNVPIDNANRTIELIESSPDRVSNMVSNVVSNEPDMKTKDGLFFGNERSSRDSSGSGNGSSASSESNVDAPCDSAESRSESNSDKTEDDDIDDLPHDSNVISAHKLSKIDDNFELGVEGKELEGSEKELVESTGEEGKMAVRKVKSALKWLWGSGEYPKEDYNERMEGMSDDFNNNPDLFDDYSQRIADFEYGQVADDVTRSEIDAIEIDNLESNVFNERVNFDGGGDAFVENAPNPNPMDTNDDCDLEQDIKQDVDPSEEIREIKENIIERLLNEEGYQVDGDNLKRIINCGNLPESKYSQIDLKLLLICNEKDGVAQRPVKTFADGMSKRGMDLLMPANQRSNNFKYVYIGGSGCFSVKGGRKYLEMMGYEYQDKDCLKFPEGKEVNRQLVAEMVLDFLILKEELEDYIYHLHPHQTKIDEILKQELPEVEPVKEITVPPVEESTKVTVTEKHPESEMFSRRQGHGSQWLPETKKMVQESLRPPHCDLCGSTAPAVRCEKCANQVFCMSCDDMYHRHPKRRSHSRKAVDHSPLPPPRPPPKYANTMNPPQPPPRRNRKTSAASPVLGRKPMEQKPALPRKESTIKGISNWLRGRPLPPSPTKAPVQSPNFNKNDPWGTSASQFPQQHRGANSLMTDSSSRHSSGSSAAGPNPVHWPIRQTVTDPGLQNMDMSSSDVEDEVTRVCGGGERMRAQPGFYPDQRFDTMPQPNQQLGRRHTFLEPRDTLERGFSGRSSMQHSTSTSDIQAASQFAGSQPGVGYQIQSMANLCSLPPMMQQYGPMCTCNTPPTQDIHGTLHRNPCPMHTYYYPQQPSPYFDRSSSLQRGFGSGYSLNYMGPMGPVSYMPMYGHPPPHLMAANDPQVSDAGSTSRGRPLSPTSSVTSSRLRKAKSEAVAVGQQQNTRRRRKFGVARNHQKNASSEEDYFSPGGSEDDDFRSIRSSARSPEGRAWLCEHCTFKNVPGTNICGVCCKTSAKPKVAARRVDMKVEQNARPQPLPRTRMDAAKEKSNVVMNLYDELPTPKSVAAGAVLNVEQTIERLQGLAVSKQDSSTATEMLEVQSPVVPSPQKDVDDIVTEQPKESPEAIATATSPPKQLISKGTSPPPRTISTQTPSATNTVENWHPLDNVQPTRNPSHSSGVMPRSSSRMSLAGDTSNEFVPQIRRAASIQAGPSGGFGSSVPWSSSGSGYRGGGYRASSRGSSGSEQGFSPPMSPRATSPVALMSGSRREKHGRQYHHQDAQDTRIRGGASSRQEYYLGLEELVERRRHETMKAQGLELVKMLREAEIHNFTADDLQIALHHCNSQNPVRWLEENLRNMTDTVVTLATNFGHDRKDNDIGIVSTSEAKDALRVHKGNVWAAVTECVELRQKKYAQLKARGNFTREEIVAALTSNQGNVELAFADLNKASLKPFLMRIWGPPTGAENEASPARSTVSPPQPCLVEPVTTVIQTPFKLSKEPEVRNTTEEIETLVYESDVDDLPEDLERLEQFEDAVEDAVEEAVEEAEDALFNLDMNALTSALVEEALVPNTSVVMESAPVGGGGGHGEDVEVVCVPLELEEVPRVEVVMKVHTSCITIDVKPPTVTRKPIEEVAGEVEVVDVEVVEEEKFHSLTPITTNQHVTPTHQLEFERNVRKLLAERKVSSYEKAEIAAKLLELKFDQSEALEAAHECSTVDLAINYLQQECRLCFDLYPMSKMVAMLYCEHQCCRICAEEYFKTQIRNRNVVDIMCPFCNPLSSIDDEEVFNEYFARLDILLRDVVSAEVHELFQQKLRDWTFEKLGNVKWCAQCKNGYGIPEQNQKRLVCPHCNSVICALCECKWEKQHDGISCDQFAEWKKDNDPEFQAEGLEKHLAEHGISCPKCNHKYSLAKGGCMHFKCLQCKFQFCSGCGQQWYMGSKCNVSKNCSTMGLHAHHPRNCLFYLRDKDPDKLQKLLDDSCVPYDTEAAQNDKCLVNVQIETPTGLIDGHCGIEVGENYAGLCRMHYIEYLANLVWSNKLDPISVLSEDELEVIIRRTDKRLPPRPYGTAAEVYRASLIKYLVDMINRNSIDPIEMLDEAELAQELRRHDKVVPEKAPKEVDVAYCVRLKQLITEQIPLEDVCSPTQA